MGVLTINTAELNQDYKPLLYKMDVTRGSTSIELKTVNINVYDSFISGDNEVSVLLTAVNSGSVDHTGYGNPVGLPVGFTPSKLIIENAIVQNLGVGATLTSIELQDNLGSPLGLPATITLTQDSTTVAFIIAINTLSTGTTNTSFTLNIVVENADSSVSILKTLIINITNNS